MRAIYLCTKGREILVHKHSEPDEKDRIYWLGGSGSILPLIFNSYQAAYAELRKVKREFREKYKESIYRPHRFIIKKVEIIEGI